MVSEQNTLLRLLKNGWEDSLRGRSVCLFLSTDQTAEAVADITAWASDLPVANHFVAVDLEKHSARYAYAPAMDILRTLQQLEQLDIDAWLQAAPVYQPQRPLFARALRGQPTLRDEALIPDEVAYERDQIKASLTRLMISASSTTPTIVVIGGLHAALTSTLDWIDWMRRHPLQGTTFFIFTLNRYPSFAADASSERWDQFLAGVESSGDLLELRDDDQKGVANWLRPSMHTSISDTENLRLARDALNLLALDDARAWSEAMLRPTDAKDRNVENELEALHILGDACFYLDDLDAALVHLQAASDLAQSGQYFVLLADVFRRMAYVYARRQDVEAAYHYAQKGVTLASEYGDPAQLLECYFCLYLVAQDASRHIDANSYNHIATQLQVNGKSLKYAHFCAKAIFFPEHHPDPRQLVELCDKAIAIYTELDNKFGLAAAYHRMGMIYSILYDAEHTIFYLKRSEELRIQLGEERDIVIIANGIGYYFTLIENYVAAFSYFKKAVSRLSTLKDYTVVASTLFNLGMLYFLTRNFSSAADVFARLIRFMRILRIDKIPFHSMSKVYSLLGICYSHTGQAVRAMGVLAHVRSLSPARPGAGETNYYLALLQALVAGYEGDAEQALEWYNNAPSLLDANVKANRRLMPQFYGDFGRFLGSSGMLLQASEQFERGLMVAEEVGFFRHRVWLEHLIASGVDHPIEEIPNIALEIDPIFEVARRDITLDQLHRKIGEIRFINQIERLFSKGGTKDSLAAEFVSLIHANLEVDVVTLQTWKNGALDIRKQIAPAQFRFTEIESWKDSLSRSESAELIRVNSVGGAYGGERIRYLINVPLHRDKRRVANLLVAAISDGFTLSEEDKAVLHLVFSQFVRMFEKIDQDDALVERNRQLRFAYEALDGKHRELKLLQNQLVQAEKMSGLGTLVAGVAHEINNPLNFVSAGTENVARHLKRLEETLAKAVDPEANQEEWNFLSAMFRNMETQMRAVASGVERIQSIVLDLRTFSRFDDSDWQDADLSVGMRATLNLVRASLREAEVRVDAHVEPVGLVGCYAAQIQQALMNVLVNAVEAVQRRRLTATAAYVGSVAATLYAESDWVCIEVRDNGDGIAPEVQRQMFDPFYTTKPVGQGKGLGLSTVYSVMQKHDGRVQVESAPGVGTRVVLFIPRHRNKPVASLIPES